MKFWALSAVLVVTGGLKACSSSGSSSGGGGEGGDSSATSSKAATSSGTGQGGAGQGGAGQGGAGQGGAAATGCDAKGLTCQAMSGESCQSCATSEGQCKDEFEACGSLMDMAHPCAVLNKCYAGCQAKPMAEQAACAKQCDMDTPAGVMPLNALLMCFICDECPMSCPTQSKGCPP